MPYKYSMRIGQATTALRSEYKDKPNSGEPEPVKHKYVHFVIVDTW